ncbi:uncharacterized protein HMPREF1541_00105 [Cyphellophora europaea CBS 101466]|uniref:DUF6604 domain-containing protein n=1 Tax=Cyphellophora europaea (strain CBS 101466) TaxID=1220924 RepID=W2SDG4_CYPE1|nr:uncharacterized protein HMPREF1541_00105 [Cyphellophora europaea CBS 101466]ETN45924.1 hypothetical protein HMPREF1541_00105 [Cyphellophora europaea CBS 101466]
MLLNPTHEITLSGLPPDVLDAYVRYKKGTRAIVAWVVQYAPSHYAGARKLPIKELARLCALVTGKITQLPDVIHFYFRETIAARKRLSKYFRGFRDESLEDADTVNHEHFTISLTNIYANLCAICENPKQTCRGDHRKSEPDSPTSQLRNLYAGLAVEGAVAEDAPGAIDPLDECAECRVDTARPCPGPQKDLPLADDELGNAIEYASALQEIQDTVQEVERCWVQAAEGAIHFVSAAFVTHVGYAILLRAESRLRELDENITVAELQRKCCMILDQTSSSGETSTWHALLERLASIQHFVRHQTNAHDLQSSYKTVAVIQKPLDYVGMGIPAPRLISALIENIIALVQSKHIPSAIVRNSTPVYADLGYALLHGTKDNSMFRLSIGLDLLCQAYTSHVLALQRPKTVTHYRLTALKLAQNAATSIERLLGNKDCFPCRCVQTLAYHLQNLEEDLVAFAKHNRWDLYFQSPYVSGSHILEILDSCHYYGSKLFVYRHYMGALVHSYNVLKQLGGLEEIPLMEYLCEEFKQSFFPAGQRPSRSFRASWTRYIGARIKFKRGHRRNNKDSWCMAIPPHEARKAAGLGVGRDEGNNDKGGCMIFKIKQQDYDVTDAQWASCETRRSDDGNLEAKSVLEEAKGTARRLENLLPLLDSHLATTSTAYVSPPKARLNRFAVFEDCVKIVSKISNATHTDPKERNMNCICFASAILEGGDRILDARAGGRLNGKGACWTKDEREGVLKTTMEAMKNVLAGKGMSRWAFHI